MKKRKKLSEYLDCKDCKYYPSNTCHEMVGECMQHDKWTPKPVADEKPKVKKYKYVCKNCDVRKCKCTFNEKTGFTTNGYCHIANCYANYELKRVKEKV